MIYCCLKPHILLDLIINEKTKKRKRRVFEHNLIPEILIIPANISTSMLYSFIEKSKHGILMIESEADTLSKMFKNDWSSFSDVLRTIFHHETLSQCRKDDMQLVYIKEPKLSLILSGTPDQKESLMISQKNGLSSRFIIYSFNDISPFKDVFSDESKKWIPAFKDAGETIFKLYFELLESKSI